METEDQKTQLTAVATPVPPNKDEAPLQYGKVVPVEYQHLPEAVKLVWNDAFFDKDETSGIVAVFDFDYVQMEQFRTSVAVAHQAGIVGGAMLYSSILLAPTGWIGCASGALGVAALYGLSLQPCLLTNQVRWKVRANHVAVTRDGIRFVQDQRKTCWGWSMCDKGKSSKTVPFDKITDCDIEEPAGNECLCIPRVLMQVNVDTASSGGGSSKRHELTISGLKEPHKFKALVWAMKRANEGVNRGYNAPQVVEMTERKLESQGGNTGSDVAGLLTDIRDELRRNNVLLQKMQTGSNNAEVNKVAQQTSEASVAAANAAFKAVEEPTTFTAVEEPTGTSREIV